MLDSLWQGIGDFLNGILEAILSVLPDSPFQSLMNNEAVSDILGYVNYFIPFDFILSVLQAWIVAVGGYYVWQLILRWIKAVE